ncbi:type I restriction endonuclease [uncultured Campylobacter sp.]|uniref:type I restriction endonuclease n=1 Tax=uncultured Campylobacter sp. TaxID=218934 RepID=UPI002609B99C|nr:type I restriction endonuclease [uncultured Campylobacter sp.]
MDLYEDLQRLGARISSIKDSVQTEEATKHSFVMPFFQILGYDIFDPNVIVPEFTADVGIKKGEKVDYAIMYEGKPLIIVEVKKHTEALNKHSSQLYRYFGVTDAKFALLTNGIEYRFYSDINKENRLDDNPFLIVNLDELNKRDVKALERFTKSDLNISSILEMANKQRRILEIKKIFEEETAKPSDDLARMFACRILPQGTRITGSVLEDFKSYTKTALSEIVTDLASKKINSVRAGLTANITDEDEESSSDETKIITTQDELQGFFIIKSILGEYVELDKIYARDTQSYFGVLFDDNNRKWIARLHFNTAKKYIGIHEIEKQETRYPLEKLEDIYKFRDKLIATLKRVQGAEDAE